MLKIRLSRIGTKKKPFYRVVVVDERTKRTGAYIELLGTYNPLTQPKDIKLKKERIDYWIKQGAQPSTGYLRVIGKAPQRPPRKPKKESKQGAGDSRQAKQQPDNQKIEEAKPEETVQPEAASQAEPETQVKPEESSEPIKQEASDNSEKTEEIKEEIKSAESEQTNEGSA